MRSILIVLILSLIISGCANNDNKNLSESKESKDIKGSEAFEPIKPEESLEHLNFLKSSEKITIYDDDEPQPVNPYLITDDADKIEKLVSTFTNKKGEIVVHPRSDKFSDNLYKINFDRAIRENGESINVSIFYDYDRNILSLIFKPGNKDEEQKQALVHPSKEFKEAVDDALKRAETTLTEQEMNQLEEMYKSVE